MQQYTNQFNVVHGKFPPMTSQRRVPNFVKNPPTENNINSIHDIPEVSSELLSDDDATDPRHQISSIYSPNFDLVRSPSSDSFDSTDSMASSSSHLRPIINSLVTPSELTNQQAMEMMFNDPSPENTSDATILAPEVSSAQSTVTTTDIEMSLSNLQLCSVTQTATVHDSSPAISPSSSFDHDTDFFTPMIASKTELISNIPKSPQSKTENFPSHYTNPTPKHFSEIPKDVYQPSKWRQHTQ
jgi:hypothetical protein